MTPAGPVGTTLPPGAPGPIRRGPQGLLGAPPAISMSPRSSAAGSSRAPTSSPTGDPIPLRRLQGLGVSPALPRHPVPSGEPVCPGVSPISHQGRIRGPRASAAGARAPVSSPASTRPPRGAPRILFRLRRGQAGPSRPRSRASTLRPTQKGPQDQSRRSSPSQRPIGRHSSPRSPLTSGPHRAAPLLASMSDLRAQRPAPPLNSSPRQVLCTALSVLAQGWGSV
ncbi:hypothetical protein NDU88_005655 [Pleurodeles waltl]|uniref:Uncharacterized protein n=1 Tax=Pleurodeles waltl TaxID=8319 RepID=A0AAV7RKA2_PLEWA|nr:hypothetical protein NDU88_005655 [Pleurodeles waltl]